MGIVVFYWAPEANNQLTLAMNRDNWDNRVISQASWDGEILCGRCQENNGTWFGISRRGRVAFLVDVMLSENKVGGHDDGSELYPIDFLKSDLSPERFAEQVAERERAKRALPNIDDNGLYRFSLIVADVAMDSMFHIRNPHQNHLGDLCTMIEPVPYGLHTLSPAGGLDCTTTRRDLRVRNFFSRMISDFGLNHLPPLGIIADWFLLPAEEDEDVVFFTTVGEPRFGEEQYRTTSTTLSTVQRTGVINFLEKCTNDNGPCIMAVVQRRWSMFDYVRP